MIIKNNILYFKVFCLLITIIGLILTIALFKTNNGDPLINLVFSKSFNEGFFFYGNEGPKWGATSPLFVFLMRPFFIISNAPSLILFKAFYLILFIFAGLLLFKVSSFLFKKNKWACFIVMPLFFGNIYFGYLTATLYDSILLLLIVNSFLLFLFYISEKINDLKINYNNKHYIFLGILGGLAPLTRPESLIFILVSYIWLYLFAIKKGACNIVFKKLIFSSFLITIIINILFYGAMMLLTESLIPSSILARATLSSNGFINVFHILASRFWMYKIINLFIIFSFLSLFYFSKYQSLERNKLFLLFLVLVIYLPMFFYSGEVRYISSIFSVLILLSSITIYYLIRVLMNLRKLFFISFCIGVILVYSVGVLLIYKMIPVYDEEIIFEKNAASLLNSVSNNFDKCLAYEIQVQYFLNCQTISMDGIVGGEILPYFIKKSDLSGFLFKYKPEYFILSDAFSYRDEFKNTILYDLYINDYNIEIGQFREIKNIKFTKLFINQEEKVPGLTSWRSIYKIEYKRSI